VLLYTSPGFAKQIMPILLMLCVNHPQKGNMLLFIFIFNYEFLFVVFNKNEYQESSWGKGRMALNADNPTAICEPIV
jgi:hypothetical protein